jgi:hypothetical protein
VTTRTMLKTADSKPTRTMGLPRKSFLGSFPIHLYKYGQRYAVQYGQQLDWDLSYTEACSKLGETLMHRCTLDGELS